MGWAPRKARAARRPARGIGVRPPRCRRRPYRRSRVRFHRMRIRVVWVAAGVTARFGVVDPAVAKSLQAVPKTAQEKIMRHFTRAGVDVNGWRVMTNTGTYGTDYLQRAFITAIGLGANRPQD